MLPGTMRKHSGFSRKPRWWSFYPRWSAQNLLGGECIPGNKRTAMPWLVAAKD